MEQGFWLALLIGGVVVAGLSAAQQVATSSEPFRTKPVGRDFIFGAFLSAMVYYLMPETVLTMVEKGQEVVTTATRSLSGGGNSIGSDIDLHVGPARF
jgi:hypothetical protein